MVSFREGTQNDEVKGISCFKHGLFGYPGPSVFGGRQKWNLKQSKIWIDLEVVDFSPDVFFTESFLIIVAVFLVGG